MTHGVHSTSKPFHHPATARSGAATVKDALAAALCAYPPSAQDAGLSASEIAKLVQNPLSDASLVPFANDANFGDGPCREAGDVLHIRLVAPVQLTLNWHLVTRTTIPVVSQVGASDSQGREFGVGDPDLERAAALLTAR